MDILLKKKKSWENLKRASQSLLYQPSRSSAEGGSGEGIKKGKQEILDKTARENKLSIEDKRKCERTRKKRNKERRKRT